MVREFLRFPLLGFRVTFHPVPELHWGLGYSYALG